MKYVLNDLTDYYEIDCYDKDKIVGYINYKIHNDEVWLNKIKVDKEYRNHGIGTNLLGLFENECFNHFKHQVFGKYYPEDEDGNVVKSFYTKHGYSIFKEGYDTEIFKYLEKRPTLDGINLETKNNISR